MNAEQLTRLKDFVYMWHLRTRIRGVRWDFSSPSSAEWGSRFEPDSTIRDTGIDLEGADLYGFLFPGPATERGPFHKANFRNACLTRTRWVDSYVKGADFTCSDLCGCEMVRVRAPGATFREANLTDAALDFLTLKSDEVIDFSRAILKYSTFVISDPCPFIFAGADVTGMKVKVIDTDDKDEEKKVVGAFLTLLTDEQKSVISGVSGKKCFVATAAYGSETHPDVAMLRAFRDQVLSLSSLPCRDVI